MMKTTNKLILVLLVLALTLSLAVPLFATDGDPDQGNGKITITNAVPGQTYSVYRIFDLQSYNKAEQAYLYTVNNDWNDFIKQTEISGDDGYVKVDAATELVTWTKVGADNNPTGVVEFAEKALAYAKNSTHPITAVTSRTAGSAASGGTTATVTFTDLPLGYYLVDSSLGALCALNTTNPNVEMSEKNGTPIVEKKVLEGSAYGDEASAQIGDTVSFKTTITPAKGAENYVLHDKMSPGLEYVTGSVKVYKTSDDNLTDDKIVNNGYEVKITGLENSNPCTFHVVFTDEFYKKLAAGDTIVVTYDAILTDKAIVGNAGENTNETWLNYGDNNSTEHSKVTVHTYQFQLVKTDEGNNGIYNVLSGAKFKLYDAETNGNVISFVKDGQNYRVATEEDGNAVDEIEAGTPIIKGLDAKKYWLEETKAPDGFNTVTGRTEVDLSSGDILVKTDKLVTAGAGTTYSTSETEPGGGVQVINKAGSKLPSTGGIGTTIFYVLGGILVIGAGILLAIRLRRPSEEK